MVKHERWRWPVHSYIFSCIRNTTMLVMMMMMIMMRTVMIEDDDDDDDEMYFTFLRKLFKYFQI